MVFGLKYWKQVVGAALVATAIPLFIGFTSSSEFQSVAELRNYVLDEENGLIQKHQVGKHRISITYRPVDLILASRVAKDDEAQNEKLREEYGKGCYFILSISVNDRPLLAEYADDLNLLNNIINKFAFGMSESVSVTGSNGKTTPLMSSVLPRMYDMSGSTQILLTFSREDLMNMDEFEISISDLIKGVAEQRFTFKTEDLKIIPNLNLGNLNS